MAEKRNPVNVVKQIRKATARKFSAEEKIRVVLEGLRGEVPITELCRKEGLNYEVEPYGSPAKTSELVADADVPMDEFWTDSKGVGDGVARAAIYAGKPVVAAEAFTAKPSSPDAK